MSLSCLTLWWLGGMLSGVILLEPVVVRRYVKCHYLAWCRSGGMLSVIILLEPVVVRKYAECHYLA